MINIIYEATLLGAIIVTVAGVIFESRLPDFGGDPYDERIAEGYVGILVRARGTSAEEVLKRCGAIDIVRSGASQ
jgi:hypothetical protein